MTPTGSTDALLEEVVRSASNKGCTLVEAALPGRPGGPRPLGGAGVRPGRSAHPTNRGRGGKHRAPHLITAPPSSAIAPAERHHNGLQGVIVSKNVAVFVDVANIFYAAKAAGVDIDYVTLLKSASAGRDLVRAYAYTGLDPDNENQRNFHDFLRRHGYKVVSKDIRKYGDGKVKANLDIELVVDMMKTARNLDIAIVVSGDGDFAPAIRAVQEMGVRCEVISFRGNTSSDLIEVADLFTDITQLARVEKGSRSGRRVADDDADLSMTEVPDKQTEGTGRRPRRTRPRRPRSRPCGRGGAGRRPRRRARVADAARLSAPSTNGVASGRDGDAGLVALPGERLSKAVGNLTEADLAAAEVFTLDDLGAADDRGRRRPGRRRRRRATAARRSARTMAAVADAGAVVAVAAAAAVGTRLPTWRRGRRRSPARRRTGPDSRLRRGRRGRDEEPVAPRGPRTTPFGSVWDSQLGTPAALRRRTSRRSAMTTRTSTSPRSPST